MKKIYLFALLAAIVTGIAVYLFALSIEQKNTVEIPTMRVVVAARNIDANVPITSDMLGYQEIPTQFVATGVVLSVGDAVGKVNIFRTLAGQQILYDQLGSTEEAAIEAGGRLSYVIKEGYRAVTVSTDDISGVGWYINKGDHVDVLCSMPVDELQPDGTTKAILVTVMLLENVEVMETGSYVENAGSTATAMYSSVTLSLKPADAVKLEWGRSYGKLSFALRAVQDDRIVSPAPYRSKEG